MRKLFPIIMMLGIFGLSFGQTQRNRRALWDDPDNPPGTVTEYRLKWSTVSGGPYTNQVVIPFGTTDVTIQLAAGTYYFIVTAANLDSESLPSNEAVTTVFADANRVINLRINLN